jgi:hypothetical protein
MTPDQRVSARVILSALFTVASLAWLFFLPRILPRSDSLTLALTWTLSPIAASAIYSGYATYQTGKDVPMGMLWDQRYKVMAAMFTLICMLIALGTICFIVFLILVVGPRMVPV